jgi:ABC-type phosphate/phosphonate transport system substrate-binding protein
MAKKPLEVRLYSSVTGGVSDTHARAYTRPMIELLEQEEQLDYPVNFDLVKGETTEDLLRLGADIDAGRCHIAVLWGLEYGWLRQEFPTLAPLVILAQHAGSWVSQVMVWDELTPDQFAELKGMRLAMYRRIPLMDRLFLEKLVKQEGETVDTFFGAVEEHPTVQSAILSVRRAEADCVVVNIVAYSRHIANQPELKVRQVVKSAPFPEPLLVGQREQINALRPGLWKEVQEKLTAIHRTAQGQQCLDFWREEQFVRPVKEHFEEPLERRLREYPIEMIENVARDQRL